MPIARGRKKFDNDEKKIQDRRAAAEAGKLPWYSFKDNVKVLYRPLQEMSEESKFFSAKNGAAGYLVEHTNPDDFRKRATCTMDSENQCRGCEHYKEDYGKEFPEGRGTWRPKGKFYQTGLVKDASGEVQIVLVGLAKGLEDVFLDFDTENKGISNRWWKVTRKGNKYIVMNEDVDDFDVEAYEMVDLDSVPRDIPYDEQDRYYGLTVQDDIVEQSSDTTSSTPSAPQAAQDTW